MVHALLLASVVGGLPALRPLQPPLALYTPEVMQDAAQSSPQNGDVFLRYGGEECPGRAVSVLRAMGAALTTLERLQAWLKENPGAEAKLFKKDTLSAVAKQARSSVPAATLVSACGPWDGEIAWQYAATTPKICRSPKPNATNEQWLLEGKKHAAAVKVSAAAACQPRISTALFDPTGKTRVILNADFGGAMSATLVGDACRVDFTWDPSVEAFKAEWKSCKG